MVKDFIENREDGCGPDASSATEAFAQKWKDELDTQPVDQPRSWTTTADPNK